MKRLFLVAVAIVMAFSAKAQFSAGTYYVGASATDLGLSYSSDQEFRLGVSALAGYFLFDKFMVNAEVGYTHTDEVDDFTAGLNGRYYFRENGIYIGAGAAFVHYTRNSNDVMIPVEVGYAFYLNHYLTVEPAVYYRMSLDDFSDKSTVGLKVGFGFYF